MSNTNLMKQVLIIYIVFFTLFAKSQQYVKLQEEAAAECQNGNFSKAVELSEKAIKLAEKDKKTDKQELISLRSENAAYYLLSEQVEKGTQLFQPLLVEVSETDKYPKAELNVKQNFGIALVFLNLHREALPHLKRVYELSKTQTMKPEDLISVVGSLAICYQYKYEFTKSEQTFKEALELIKKDHLSSTVDNAYMLSSLALLYKDMQLPEKALAMYEESERVFNTSKDTLNPQFPVFLTEYGSLLAEFGQHEKALKLNFRARNIDRQMYTQNSSEYSGTLNNIGYIYSDMNRIIETEQFYEESIRIKKSLPFIRIENYLTSVSNLMNFYNKVGRTSEAMELAAELEAGLKNKDFVDTLKRAVFASNLGILFQQYDSFQKAQGYFKDALMYYEAVYGPDNDYKAEIYMNMGTLFQVQEKYEDCATYLNKAAEAFTKNPLEEGPDNINILCNLAMILRSLDKFKEAEEYANKAVELSKKFNVKDVDLLEQLYIAKAQVAGDLDKVNEAMNYFNKFLELKYGQIEQNFSYMTESEKLFFLEQFELTIRNFYTTILNNIEKYPELIKALLDFRIKTKAFLLNNLSKIKQHVKELNDPLLNQKFEDLKMKRESVAKLMNWPKHRL
jgi:tetratricopeptide (TPR) repeat protein